MNVKKQIIAIIEKLNYPDLIRLYRIAYRLSERYK